VREGLAKKEEKRGIQMIWSMFGERQRNQKPPEKRAITSVMKGDAPAFPKKNQPKGDELGTSETGPLRIQERGWFFVSIKRKKGEVISSTVAEKKGVGIQPKRIKSTLESLAEHPRRS